MGVKELVAVAGLARHARVDALPGRHRDHATTPRRRGCATRARCSSASPRRPSSDRRTGPARTCTASPATRGTPNARPADRRAVRRPRSRSGMMPICTGSDGGGSIRIPSSYSGLFGFKVSLRAGRCQRAVRQRAHVGARPDVPFGARRGALRRRDRRPDDRRPDVAADAAPPLRGRRRVGRRAASVCGASASRGRRRSGSPVCDPEVEKLAHEAAIALVADAGIELVDVDVTLPKPSGAWGSCRRSRRRRHHGAAAVGRHADVTPVSRAGFETIERIDARRSCCARCAGATKCSPRSATVFDEVDLLLTPTTATTAFVAEGPPPLEIGGQRVGGMGSVPYTAPFNISGQPAVSIPVGLSRRRSAGRLAGRRPPPRRRARARGGTRRRAATARGRSSPRWRTT